MTSLLPPELNGSGTSKYCLKTQLRRDLIAKRKQLSSEVMLQASKDICSKLISNRYWQNAKSVGYYSATKHELNLQQLITLSLEQGKTTALPKVTDSTMHFVEIFNSTKLIQHQLGFYQPISGKILQPELIILPCVGLSNIGVRLGYGKGYYDRYLSKSPATKIGVAFEVQRIDLDIKEPWDQQCDLVIFV